MIMTVVVHDTDTIFISTKVVRGSKQTSALKSVIYINQNTPKFFSKFSNFIFSIISKSLIFE